jgi:hypothetical protein
MYFDKYFQDTILYIIEIKYFINPYGSFFLLRYTTKQLKKKNLNKKKKEKKSKISFMIHLIR